MSGSFIDSALESGALWLSATETRTLKSGRQSPYFFNSGHFSTGKAISSLARGYAAALLQNRQIEFNCLFGPAYKGISLAATTAMALYLGQSIDVQFTSNRKELKDHGEGGDLIGASLLGRRVVIIEDVITRGDAKRDADRFIREHGGTPVAIVIAFDREERGESHLSASQEVQRDLGIPVIAAATVRELMAYLQITRSMPTELEAIQRYYAEYGAVKVTV